MRHFHQPLLHHVQGTIDPTIPHSHCGAGSCAEAGRLEKASSRCRAPPASGAASARRTSDNPGTPAVAAVPRIAQSRVSPHRDRACPRLGEKPADQLAIVIRDGVVGRARRDARASHLQRFMIEQVRRQVLQVPERHPGRKPIRLQFQVHHLVKVSVAQQPDPRRVAAERKPGTPLIRIRRAVGVSPTPRTHHTRFHRPPISVNCAPERLAQFDQARAQLLAAQAIEVIDRLVQHRMIDARPGRFAGRRLQKLVHDLDRRQRPIRIGLALRVEVRREDVPVTPLPNESAPSHRPPGATHAC